MKRILGSIGLLALVGCDATYGRAEFAAPQDRWPSTLPSEAGREFVTPPTVAQFCYRTLATVDCFLTPQASRTPGFTGAYPEIWPY